MTDAVSQFLHESAGTFYPSMKFTKLKDFVSGTVIDEPRIVEAESKFRKGEIDKSLVINLQVSKGRGTVAERDEDGNKEERPVAAGDHVTVWVKQGFMSQAISQAVLLSGQKTIVEGATITVGFIEEKDTGKGFPAKIYKATYEAPAAGVSIADFANEDGDEFPEF